MRNAKDTIPVHPSLLTKCMPCIGRDHLRCDCPLIFVSDENLDEDFSDEPITQVKAVTK